MRFWTHHRYRFPLPEGHRFPLAKYERLATRVREEGLGELVEPRPATWEELAEIHDADWLRRVRDGELSRREERALGLPWSAELVERGRRSTYGTVRAARDALEHGVGMGLGGGTHHAGSASGRGFCLFNDVALAVALLRRSAGLGRVLVVDLDVHQGDGTAELLGGSRDPLTFALSVHGGANYPFKQVPGDLDVALPDGTGDEAYLAAVDEALAVAVERLGRPDLVVFLAGADPWEGDRLGRLSVTKDGLRRRDDLVLRTARELGAALCVTLSGGYAPDVDDTVEINLATVRAVATEAALTEGA